MVFHSVSFLMRYHQFYFHKAKNEFMKMEFVNQNIFVAATATNFFLFFFLRTITWVDNTAATFDSSLFFSPLIQYSSNPDDEVLNHLKGYISIANMSVTCSCNKTHLALNYPGLITDLQYHWYLLCVSKTTHTEPALICNYSDRHSHHTFKISHWSYVTCCLWKEPSKPCRSAGCGKFLYSFFC